LAIRDKRWLIFPEQDPQRHQFVIGVGIPLEDLEFEALTTGYVLKAEYFLPINESDFRKDPFVIHFIEMNAENQQKRSLDSPMSRFDIYKSFEMLLNRRGLDGKQCLMVAICEAGSISFQEGFDTLGDIFHLFLTPSSTEDEISQSVDNDYIQAEIFGRAGGNCVKRFNRCNLSIMVSFHLLFKIN
uniref:Uncharacterized protein n=1 Tax=Megaselia scalaris TaxID=36166 RepID=T1GLK8_MEGSC